MSHEAPSSPTDLNSEALLIFRTLIDRANSLPEVWRATLLDLTCHGIPRDLEALEALIVTTRDEK